MKGQTLKKVRQVHNYIAVFFAPAILFFAFTGWLQTAGLADAHAGPGQPRWLTTIASLHVDQALPKPRPASHRPPGGKPAGDDDGKPAFVPEKAFVIFVAIALFVTSALGLVIAVATPSTRRTSLILIAAGIVLPLVLLL